MQKIEQLTLELVKAGQTDADVIINAIGAHSMSKMKYDVLQAYAEKKKENDQLKQLNQQLLQQQDELQKTQQQLQKLQQENQTLTKKDRELEKYKIDKTFELGMATNKVNEKYYEAQIALNQKRVELEQLQLIDNNSQNNEIKNA